MRIDQKEREMLFNRTIMVVDDNATNLGVISHCLQENGYRVVLFRDGESALKKAHDDRPDLILLELMMANVDGFEICRRLKADDSLEQIPVIFMTTLAGIDEKVKAFEMGAVDYITKPVQPEEVLVRVQTHLRFRELAERLEEEVHQHTAKLAGANQALKALLDQREIEKTSIEQTMVANLKRYILPYLEEIDQLNIGEVESYVNIIRSNIEQLIAPVSKQLSVVYLDFTPKEIKVADLIRQGKCTKTIADILNTSPSTVQKHRNQIRKKLNISHKKINLKTYLTSLSQSQL